MEDTPCKRVLLKVDSNPGCNGKELLIKCCFCGLYIYPGLPKATSVQQETDVNYSPFKSIVRDNLKQISSAFYAAGEVIPLGKSTFGLIVYGGTIPVGKTYLKCRNALNDTFDVTSNLAHGARLEQCPTPGSASQILRCVTMEQTSAIPILMSIRTSSPRMTTEPPSSTPWDTKAMRYGLFFA
jgi:hypothetical protein